jgi:hypothetical protein
MLSQNLIWEYTHPGGIRVGEHSSLVGRMGPHELLTGKTVLGSTALAGCGGPRELLIGKEVPGSKSLFWCSSRVQSSPKAVYVPGSKNFTLLPGTYTSGRSILPHEMPTEHDA